MNFCICSRPVTMRFFFYFICIIVIMLVKNIYIPMHAVWMRYIRCPMYSHILMLCCLLLLFFLICFLCRYLMLLHSPCTTNTFNFITNHINKYMFIIIPFPIFTSFYAQITLLTINTCFDQLMLTKECWLIVQKSSWCTRIRFYIQVKVSNLLIASVITSSEWEGLRQ